MKGFTKLLIHFLLVISSDVYPTSGLEISSCPDLSVHEGMSPELLCCARSTISEGQFMWSYEQNSSYQAVAIRDGATLQETFRKKIYDKDKARGILSNNLTINEKFYGRVNITYDGNLILMNSTVQDSGNYKCSYQGITGPVEESLLKLSVKPFKGTCPVDKTVATTTSQPLHTPKGTCPVDKTVATTTSQPLHTLKDCSGKLHGYKVATFILSSLLGLLVAVLVGYTFYKRLISAASETKVCASVANL